VIGSGGVVGEDHQNIAVQSAAEQDGLALACICRVLKRLKANPETTDIWEGGDSDEKYKLKDINPAFLKKKANIQRPLRALPPLGTVVAVPLRHGGFAHVVNTYYRDWWMYDFFTDAPSKDVHLFDPSNLKLLFIYYVDEKIPEETIDEVTVPVPEFLATHSKTYKIVPQYEIDRGWASTRFEADDEHGCKKYIAEEEVPNYQLFRPVYGKDLGKFLEGFRSQIKFITLREDQRLSPPTQAPIE